jgi:hypothetical protein
MNANTFASTMNIKTTEDGLVRGTVGSLKKAVAFMGFDCQTTYQDDAFGTTTRVNVTDGGKQVAVIFSRAGEAALVWA